MLQGSNPKKEMHSFLPVKAYQAPIQHSCILLLAAHVLPAVCWKA